MQGVILSHVMFFFYYFVDGKYHVIKRDIILSIILHAKHKNILKFSLLYTLLKLFVHPFTKRWYKYRWKNKNLSPSFGISFEK